MLNDGTSQTNTPCCPHHNPASPFQLPSGASDSRPSLQTPRHSLGTDAGSHQQLHEHGLPDSAAQDVDSRTQSILREALYPILHSNSSRPWESIKEASRRQQEDMEGMGDKEQPQGSLSSASGHRADCPAKDEGERHVLFNGLRVRMGACVHRACPCARSLGAASLFLGSCVCACIHA